MTNDTTPAPEGVTPEQVAAILKDVTPGPWSFFQGEDDADRAYFGVTAPSGDVCMMSNAQIWRGKQTIANARFIEWARNNLETLAADRDAQKARADAAEAKVARLVDAMNKLIDHTHNCEKELTEELHHADFCGESLPLTNARAIIAEVQG